MQWEGSLENRPRCQELLPLIDAKVNAEKVERGKLLSLRENGNAADASG